MKTMNVSAAQDPFVTKTMRRTFEYSNQARTITVAGEIQCRGRATGELEGLTKFLRDALNRYYEGPTAPTAS